MTYITNASWPAADAARPHPLDFISDMRPSPTNNAASSWPAKDLDRKLHNLCCSLLPSTASQLLKYVDVYMDDLFSLSQRNASVRQQYQNHLFH